MPAVRQSETELINHLNEQLSFLKTSCNAFDNGEIIEAKRIAVILRLLLHNSRLSISLLNQLKKTNIDFFSSTQTDYRGELLTQASLLIIQVGPEGSQYIVPFEDRPPHQFHWMSLEDWWNQYVFLDNRRRTITRKDLVLFVANQDGGAHIDPELKEVYYDLTRNHSILWKDDKGNPLGPNPALLSIRQIAFEVFKTFEKHGINH